MNLKLSKYKKILKLKKKFRYNDFEFITNYGLFSGDINLFKTLTIYDLVKQTESVKGDIIELGVFNGDTSLLFKKILDIFKIKKKLYLLDHFRGLIHYGKKDTQFAKKYKGKFVGKKKKIRSFIDFFKFKNIEIIDKDATSLQSGFFKNRRFSLAFFDMDLYLPTLKGLQAIDKNMSKGGFIVFDQGYKKNWAEKKAIKDFLKKNKKYRWVLIDKKRQPDVILKKISK